MRKVLITLMVIGLLVSACGQRPTPDLEATIQAVVAATLTALPTNTPAPTPTQLPSPTPTETPLPTPTPSATPTPPPSPTPTPPPSPTPPVLTSTPTPTLSATSSALVATEGETLRVRGGPGTDYPILGRLEPGTELTLLARSADGDWFQFAYPPGSDERGWVAGEFLEHQGSPDSLRIAQAPAKPTPSPAMVPATATRAMAGTFNARVATEGDTLRVRGGPGIDYPVLGRLEPGTELTLLARSADGDWFQFAYPPDSDERGWVAGEFLEHQGSPDTLPVVEAPSTPTPGPSVAGAVNPTLLNGSFDDYQPYVRDGEAQFWLEPQFPERYGEHWTLVVISETERRSHLMDSEIFGKFTQQYFGGGGRDYHIHGRHSQVIASRSAFDLVLMQTVAAQPGQEYAFSGSIVSFYQGTSGPPVHDKVFKTLGIDPTGGADYRSPGVVWGERDGRDNEWRYPEIRAEARADRITLFIRLENTEFDVGVTELNVIHLDDFKLQP